MEAVAEAFAASVAVSESIEAAVIVAGAVYKPAASTVPSAPACSDHVTVAGTAVPFVSSVVAANVIVSAGPSDALVGSRNTRPVVMRSE